MSTIKKLSVYQTSDGSSHHSMAKAREVQVRLNLTEALHSDEWGDSLGYIDPNVFLAFLEQNKQLVREFYNPQTLRVK